MAEGGSPLRLTAEAAGPLWRAALALALYHLIGLPLAWEYSYAGFAAAVLLAVAAVAAVPRGRRWQALAEGLVFLYVLNARQKSLDAPLTWQVVAGAAALIGYPTLARLAAGLSWRRGMAAGVLALALAAVLDPNLLPAWRDFAVRYESPPLAGSADRIPYLRLLVGDVDGDGRDEVVAPVEAPWQPDQGQLPLTARRYPYRILEFEGGGFHWRSPRPADRLPLLVRPDPVLTPPLRPALLSSEEDMALGFHLPADPFRQAALLSDPGRLPLALFAETVSALATDPPAGEGLAPPAVGLEPWRATAARAAGPAAGLAAWEAAAADLDGDGRADSMVNIPDGGALVWDTGRGIPSWWAPDMSFRFEDYGRLGGAPPAIIASAKGRWGPDPRRYVAAFRAAASGSPGATTPSRPDGAPARADKGVLLARQWKLFVPGLLFPRLLDVDGDGKRELVATAYGRHRVVILARHGWPVTSLAWLLVAIHLTAALPRRWTRFLAVGLMAATAGLAPRWSSPGLSLPGGSPAAWRLQAASPAGDRGLLERAAAATGRAGPYQYQAQVITYVRGGRNQIDLAGGVDGRRARVQAGFLGTGYGLYQEGNTVNLHDGRRWHRSTVPGAAPPPLDRSLAILAALATDVRLLPDTEIIVRTPCRVLVASVPAGSLASLPGGGPVAASAAEALAAGRYTLVAWVGASDGLIRQLQLLAAAPLRDGGAVYQKFLLTFTGFGDQVRVARPRDLPTVDTR